jgi:hypothetical protein
VAAGVCAALIQAPAAPRGDWIQLFNGRNLDGWDVKIAGHALNDNFANTFRVEDGLLKVRYDGYGEEWVRVEVLVLGDSLIRHIVNGDTVFAYAKPQIGGGVVTHYDPALKQDGLPLRSGSIALQSESHPIDFRKVELRILGPR